MFDRVSDYFMAEPRRLTRLGQALLRSSCFLLAAAAIGYYATTSLSVARGFATHSRPEVLLSDVLPAAVTWWVPETSVGVCFMLLLTACGFIALRTGRSLERFMR